MKKPGDNGPVSLSALFVLPHDGGIREWKAGRYRNAAEDWYKAFHLDPDRQDAIDWYLRAKQRLVREMQDT